MRKKNFGTTISEAILYTFFAGIVIFELLMNGMSCSNVASVGAWGKNQHIILYANDGTKIGEWYSVGQIANEGGSDGFHFMDGATRKQVRVSGTTVTVTQ